MVTEQPTGQSVRDRRLNEISQEISRGEYYVDPQAVATALLRRLLGRDAALTVPPPPQDPCS